MSSHGPRVSSGVIARASLFGLCAGVMWGSWSTSDGFEWMRFAWISMDSFGFEWMSMDFHGCLWVPMDLYGPQRMSMDFARISLDLNGFPWISMDSHGFEWI